LFGVLDVPAVLRFPLAVRPPPERFAEIVGAARRIVRELAEAETGYALLANAECARLLALYWRSAAQAGGGAGDRPQRPGGLAHAAAIARLAPVFDAIGTRHTERLTLEDLAGIVHLHPNYFSELFKTVVGVSPLRYLAQYRLDRARELLLSTHLTMREIAAAVGFGDAFYFSRAFRRAEGVSPTAYRMAEQSPGLT
jgi:AraC-like DNA-binding protein